ncbi:MAG: hypothetical protein H6Q20_267 [Bacteroidetes bacterium]|jgi:hypothetical protein|nr:hypothetical protein [Bacteroidota bacterium]
MPRNIKYKVIAAVCTLVIQVLLFTAFNFNFSGLIPFTPPQSNEEEFDIPLEQIIEDFSELTPQSNEPEVQEESKQDVIKHEQPDQPVIKDIPPAGQETADEKENVVAMEKELKEELPPPPLKKVVIKDSLTDTAIPQEIKKLLEEQTLTKKVERNTQDKRTQAERMQFYRKNYRAIRNLIKVYPYALKTRKIIDSLNIELAKTSDKSEQKRMINQTEKMLFKEYETAIRTMNSSQGKVLLKLIARETNKTGYQIIKDFKGGFSATFWYAIGKVFSTDLKTEYKKEEGDSIYEEILQRYNDGEFK